MTEPDSFTVTVPSRLRLGRRMYPLNLNLYRNAHYIIKAKLKDLFAETVRHLLPPVRYDIIEIRYDVWFGSSRRQDVMNIGAVIDKFFEDCLVSNGIIPDDNSYHVIDTHFRYAGVSKGNPHVDITVTKSLTRGGAMPPFFCLSTESVIHLTKNAKNNEKRVEITKNRRNIRNRE